MLERSAQTSSPEESAGRKSWLSDAPTHVRRRALLLIAQGRRPERSHFGLLLLVQSGYSDSPAASRASARGRPRTRIATRDYPDTTGPLQGTAALRSTRWLEGSRGDVGGEVAAQLVRVGAPDRAAMVGEPAGERDLSERRVMRDEEPGRQAADLIRREDDVADERAERRVRRMPSRPAADARSESASRRRRGGAPRAR